MRHTLPPTNLSMAKRCLAVKICLISISLFYGINAQVIPGLPELPSALPTISSSATVSPSTSIVLPSPTSAVSPSESINIPGLVPSALPIPSTTPSESPATSLPPVFEEELLPEIPPQIEVQECERNVELPAPTLGTSPLRYALSVVSGAALIGFATILYSAAVGWDTSQNHEAFRLTCVLIARVCIILAIKISASLVASISKSSPEDGALDASGAFLTWGTGILTRAYYEGFQMTLGAIDFFGDDFPWDKQLRHYLSPHYPHYGRAPQHEEANTEAVSSSRSGSEDSLPYLTIFQRLKRGRIDRQLLMIHALVYFGVEIATLVIILKDFISSLSSPAAQQIFVSGDEAGQCGITRQDVPSK